MHIIRPAVQSDQSTIKTIVRQAGINPLSLHWPNFLVSEADGRIVGIGQVKPHGDGTRELASIAVLPAYQRQGIATAIIHALLERESRPLYLTCRDRLENFYTQFGFRVISRDEMPPYFRRIYRLASVFSWAVARLGHHQRMLVMRLD
jgi:N-acetylglutamate synthase-like GNAT family acetyltransferase